MTSPAVVITTKPSELGSGTVTASVTTVTDTPALLMIAESVAVNAAEVSVLSSTTVATLAESTSIENVLFQIPDTKPPAAAVPLSENVKPSDSVVTPVDTKPLPNNVNGSYATACWERSRDAVVSKLGEYHFHNFKTGFCFKQ